MAINHKSSVYQINKIKEHDSKPKKTPPKPPVRRRVTSVITTLPTPNGQEKTTPNSTTTTTNVGTFVRQPQPRMGRGVISSIRKTHPQTAAVLTGADNSSVSSAGEIGSARSETADVLCAQGDGQPSRLEGDNASGGPSVVSFAAADDDFDFSAVGSGAVTGSRKIRKSLSCFAPLPTKITTEAKPSELSEQVLQEECDVSGDGRKEVKYEKGR